MTELNSSRIPFLFHSPAVRECFLSLINPFPFPNICYKYQIFKCSLFPAGILARAGAALDSPFHPWNSALSSHPRLQSTGRGLGGAADPGQGQDPRKGMFWEIRESGMMEKRIPIQSDGGTDCLKLLGGTEHLPGQEENK